jgi:hypothetical protein
MSISEHDEHDEVAGIAETYRAFAAETHRRSPRYEELTLAVAEDRPILGFLGTLPAAKRQPNLLADVPAVTSQAPRDATLVIFHSAVLAYVSPPLRAEFARTVRDLSAVWLSNEAPRVLPGIAAPDGDDHGFLLVRDGKQVVARTDPHGAWLDWL